MIELKEGMKLKVNILLPHRMSGDKFIEDVITILQIKENKVTFHVEFMGNSSVTTLITNFWNGIELKEIL